MKAQERSLPYQSRWWNDRCIFCAWIQPGAIHLGHTARLSWEWIWHSKDFVFKYLQNDSKSITEPHFFTKKKLPKKRFNTKPKNLWDLNISSDACGLHLGISQQTANYLGVFFSKLNIARHRVHRKTLADAAVSVLNVLMSEPKVDLTGGKKQSIRCSPFIDARCILHLQDTNETEQYKIHKDLETPKLPPKKKKKKLFLPCTRKTCQKSNFCM